MRIDVFHDTACPWCRIGKQNLKLALEQWQGEPVEVHYHSFFLNPAIPPEGHEFLPYMSAKGGGTIAPEQFFAGPRDAGAQAGLTFNFEKITRAPNTMLSHRLIALAPDAQREALIDAVYAAYFEHGQDIGDLDVLVNIAAAHGMDPADTRHALEGDVMHDQVLAQVQQAQQLGVSGVPFFVFNNALAFSGAQPPEIILRVMAQVNELVNQEGQ
jgi:predicted DsbA family dithiol-disulfide isomerase